MVVFMDVLEHVDDDIQLLKEYSNKVSRGSYFLISVPAFQFLWSGHDVFLEHKRRYRLSQVEDVVRQAGLSVKYGAYYFGAIFPIVLALRIFINLLQGFKYRPRTQLSRHNPFVNGLLALMSSVELSVFLRNRLAGLTVFVLAEKP